MSDLQKQPIDEPLEPIRNDDSAIDPNVEHLEADIENELDIPPPQDDVAAKKANKNSKTKKMLGWLGGAAFLVLLGYMAFSMVKPPATNSQVAEGQVSTNIKEVNQIGKGAASEKSTNPEAAQLGDRVQKDRAAEILKDPTQSYVTADPFGSGQREGNFTRAPGDPAPQTEPPPPQPPQAPVNIDDLRMEPVPTTPPTTTAAANHEHDAAIASAQAIVRSALAIPTPGWVGGNAPKVTEPPVTTTQVASNAGKTADISTGDITYAQLTSGLKSLIPQTPARAVLRGGKFNGAVLMGSMQNANDQYLVLRFSSMTWNKKTYQINAIAINADENMDAGIVDKVNSKVWSRAALMAGVGFIQAVGASKMQEGTTTTNSPYGSSTSVGERSNSNTAMIGLGGAGQAVQDTVQQEIAKMKDEVVVYPGKEIGVIFLQPLYLQP